MTIFFLSSDCFCQTVKVELFNRTHFDLDSVKIDNYYVGFIKKDSSIIIQKLTSIVMEDILPFWPPCGIIKEKNRSVKLVGLCGTGKRDETMGEYKFDIIYREDDDGYRLLWDKHK